MPNVDFLDRLQYPQYEQGGRFNLLSLFQLPYAFTPGGTREITRRKGLRQRAEEAAVAQPEAEVKRTQASTGAIGSQTEGQDVANRTAGFNLSQAQEAARRDTVARNALAALAVNTPGIPGSLPQETIPEFISHANPITQFARSAEQYGKQNELGNLELAQNRGLAERGIPLTQPGQQERHVTSAETVAGLKARSDKELQTIHSAMQTLAAAYGSQNPAIINHAVASLQQMGVPAVKFNQATIDNGPAAAINSELQARRAGGGAPSAPPAPAAPVAPNPRTPTNPRGLPGQPGAGVPGGVGAGPSQEAIQKRLRELLGPTGLVSGQNPFSYLNTPFFQVASPGLSSEEQASLIPMLEQIAGGKQRKSITGVDIPGEQFPMTSVQEVLDLLRRLQGGR